MKIRYLHTLFLILCIFTGACKEIDEKFFISSGGKVIGFTEMDDYFLLTMDSLDIPGITVAVINDAEVIYHRTLGVENTKTRKKIDDKTIFEAASFSKPLFAYFVMKQVEKGLLNLDKPLYEYLPYTDIEYDERYKLITTRMVLSHQTGFPNWRFNEPDKKLDIEFDPGTSFQYSGEAYQYLASVVAHLNNVKEGKLDSIFQIEVAKPLGVDNLFYNWNDSIAKYKAYGHRHKENKPTNNSIGDIDIDEFGAAHSLHTEAINYSRFVIALMKREGLNPESYSELFKEHVLVPEDNILRRVTGSESWSLGFAVQNTLNGQIYSHFGDNNGDFSSYFNFYPENNSGIIIFMNSWKIWSTSFINDLAMFLGEDFKCDISQLD